jgi:uncharacterized membrane protein YczE
MKRFAFFTRRQVGRESVRKIGMYLAGCAVFATGAYLFIHSRLGTDPLDVFSLGLLNHVPLTIGLAQTLVAVACLLCVAIWTQKRPLLSPLWTFFFCGSLIDILCFADAGRWLPLPPFAVMLAGAMLCAYGSSLIIMSGFGIRAMDLLALVMSDRWHWPFWLGKGVLEGLLLLSGAVMGGPVGIGTVTFFIIVDGCIQPLMWVNRNLLGLPQYWASPADYV